MYLRAMTAHKEELCCTYQDENSTTASHREIQYSKQFEPWSELMVVNACNLSSEQAETEGLPQTQGHLVYTVSSRPRRGPHSKEFVCI